MLTYIPIVYCFFPETAGRTLEQIDFLFSSKSPFVWDEEEEFAKHMVDFNAEIQKIEIENGRCAGNEKGGKKHVENV